MPLVPLDDGACKKEGAGITSSDRGTHEARMELLCCVLHVLLGFRVARVESRALLGVRVLETQPARAGYVNENPTLSTRGVSVCLCVAFPLERRNQVRGNRPKPHRLLPHYVVCENSTRSLVTMATCDGVLCSAVVCGLRGSPCALWCRRFNCTLDRKLFL